MQAIFVSGNPLMIPYTPDVAVSAGDVIVEGAKCYIAHHDIAAGELGAVAASGGLYDILGSNNDVIAIGDKVWWNDSGNNATESATSNNPLGWCAADKASGDATVRVEHGAW
jgi:predicted RecA/RadA family phage recombinase